MTSDRAADTPARTTFLSRFLRLVGLAALPAVLGAIGFVALGPVESTGSAADESDEATQRTASAAELRELRVVEPVSRESSSRASRPRDLRQSADRSSRLASKSVLLVVRGTATQVVTRARTVHGLLEEAEVELSDDDRLRPAPDTALADGMRVVVEVVDIETEVRTETIDHETVRRETSDRLRGEEVVVQDGRDGERETTIERVYVDGSEESVTVVGEEVTEPVNRIVEIGTAAPPEPDPEPEPERQSADNSVWDRLAQCESNGNWSANTGNGFYGGLQFMKETWDVVGGQEFAEYPHQASREQQIAAAERLLAKPWGGWSQWPACSRRLGLR